jgi:hypothetical protein
VKQKSKKHKLFEKMWHEEFVSEVYKALSNLMPRSARDIQKIFNDKEGYPKLIVSISALNKILNNDLKDKTIRIGEKYLRRENSKMK